MLAKCLPDALAWCHLVFFGSVDVHAPTYIVGALGDLFLKRLDLDLPIFVLGLVLLVRLVVEWCLNLSMLACTDFGTVLGKSARHCSSV